VILETNAVSWLFAGVPALNEVLASRPRHHLPVIVIGEYRSARRSGLSSAGRCSVETPCQGMQNVRGEPERCEQEPSVTKARHE
jgi:hypothetical protein